MQLRFLHNPTIAVIPASAGIQKNRLDTGRRRYDELTVDSCLC